MPKLKQRFNVKKSFEVIEVAIPTGFLINKEIESPVYMDALKFELNTTNNIELQDMVKNFFRAQPIWLLAIMINITSRIKLKARLDDNDLSQGSHVGHWRIAQSTDGEIVFSESMGFIEHRLAFCKKQSSRNEFMTVSSVKTHNQLGRLYFFFVKLVHLRLIKFAINNMYRERYQNTK